MRIRWAARAIWTVMVAAFATHCAGADAIHEAAERGDIGAVRKLVEGNPELVKAVSNAGWTPLHYAASNGKKSVVTFLLANKADVNAAATGFDAGITPLLLASQHGRTDVALLLLEKGANASAKSTGIMYRDAAPLYFAVTNLDKVLVEKLLTHKADPNEKQYEGETAIITLLGRQRTKANEPAIKSLLTVLVGAGANVDARDREGNTALHRAVNLGLPGVVQSLINQKSDVNAKNDRGQTPFVSASKNGDKIVMEMLKRSGGKE